MFVVVVEAVARIVLMFRMFNPSSYGTGHKNGSTIQ